MKLLVPFFSSVDHTRVVLTNANPGIPGSDYINANYIEVCTCLLQDKQIQHQFFVFILSHLIALLTIDFSLNACLKVLEPVSHFSLWNCIRRCIFMHLSIIEVIDKILNFHHFVVRYQTCHQF